MSAITDSARDVSRPAPSLAVSPRLALTGFIVFGVVTFWAYTAVRLALVWREHVARRWLALAPKVAESDAKALRARGFDERIGVPLTAAALFALCALLVCFWFVRGIVLGEQPGYDVVVPVVGLSSALFFVATCLLVVWFAQRVRAHELIETAIIQGRDPDSAPGDDVVARWEHMNNHVALFLIVALPITASPTVGAHLFLTGRMDTAALVAIGCFVAAGVFHFWGTRLLLGLYNDHVALERSLGATAVPRRVGAPAPSATPASLEPYTGNEPFIFVSYKRDDLERILPILERIVASGHRVWYDKGIPGSAEWAALLESRISACALFAFFVSRASVESTFCRREIGYAIKLDKPVLSIRLEDAELKHGLDMMLSAFQTLDANTQDFSRDIARALEYVRLL